MSRRVGRARHMEKKQGKRVMVAGESFPVFGLRSVTSLFNVGLRSDRVFTFLKQTNKQKTRTVIDNTW